MTTLYENFDKNKIKDLPQVLFKGRIVVIDTAADARKAVDYLIRQPILGLDTETRPSFRKGVNYKVGLLQISTHDICFLFRLNRMGMPDCVTELLADGKNLKVGLSLKDDLRALHERAGFDNGRYVELQDYARHFGIMDMSLQKLYANVYGQRISKTQRLTNWEAAELSESQQRYAATDAWACVMLYEKLKKLDESQEYKLVSRVDADRLTDDVVRSLYVSLKPVPKPRSVRKKTKRYSNV
jgi:ribonuclease D